MWRELSFAAQCKTDLTLKRIALLIYFFICQKKMPLSKSVSVGTNFRRGNAKVLIETIIHLADQVK